MVEYRGEIYPVDFIDVRFLENYRDEHFFMIPDDYRVLRKVRVKVIDVNSVNDPKSRKYKYKTVKKYKKIDFGLWILCHWGDAVPTYEICWKDIYGRHKYSYGKGQDCVVNHSFINAVAYVLGLSKA